MNEVIAPNMITVFWPESDARSVCQPEPAFLRLLCWHFQPLSSPQALDASIANRPACITQKNRNPAIAIPSVLPSQLDHIRDQSDLIGTALRHATLCGTVLAQDAANATLRHAKRVPHLVDTPAAASGA